RHSLRGVAPWLKGGIGAAFIGTHQAGDLLGTEIAGRVNHAKGAGDLRRYKLVVALRRSTRQRDAQYTLAQVGVVDRPGWGRLERLEEREKTRMVKVSVWVTRVERQVVQVGCDTGQPR